MKKRIIAAALILFLVTGFCILKLFVIGAPADENSLAVRAEADSGQLAIYIESTDSAQAISNIRYRYDGTALHLTVWKVLASPLCRNGNKCLYYEITDETEIWLGNRLIWTAD